MPLNTNQPTVRSCILHGSETWPVHYTKEYELVLHRTEINGMDASCKFNDELSCVELIIEDVITVQVNRLKWYVHVLRKAENDCM